MDASVTLRPVTGAEYERFLARAVREYADDKVASGEFTPETAVARSRAEFDTLLPAGPDTPGMLLFSAVDGTAGPDAPPVGLLWLALPDRRRRQAWVYELWVEPGCRGRGYGRAIMRAGEREMAARAVNEVGLNVFGHNQVAVHLYESLGYRVTAQQMSKIVTRE